MLTLDEAAKLGTLTLDQVAELLSLAPDNFAKRRGRLQARYDFPRALPGCGNVWSSRLVRAWIDAGGRYDVGSHEPAAAPDDPLEALVASDRQRLREMFKEP